MYSHVNHPFADVLHRPPNATASSVASVKRVFALAAEHALDSAVLKSSKTDQRKAVGTAAAFFARMGVAA